MSVLKAAQKAVLQRLFFCGQGCYPACDIHMLIVATQSSEYLAEDLSRLLGARLIGIERSQFPNGERYIQIEEAEDFLGQDVLVIASITSDEELLEVYRLGSTLFELGTRRRVFVIPYLAYSTMEVAKHSGEVVTAKTNARLLSSMPGAHANSFLFCDLHEPSLKHYFEDDATVFEISAIELLAKAIKQENISDPIVCSADLGMPQQTQQLAQLLQADVALVSKSREFSHTAVLAAVGDVKDRNVIIYDDMIRSGGSLIQAAKAYEKAGAKEIGAAVSHFAISTDDVMKKLRNSPIKKIITTNSYPATQKGNIRRTPFIDALNINSAVAKMAKKLVS